MRLDDDIQYLKGIGPARAERLRSAGFNTIRDVLDYFPRDYITHQQAIPIRDLREGDYVTVVGNVLSANILYGRRRRLAVTVSDGSGIIRLMYFSYLNAVKDRFQPGMTIAATGKVGYFSGFQIVHPETEIISEDAEFESGTFIVPIYSISESLKSAKLTTKSLRSLIRNCLEMVEIQSYDEVLPASIRAERGFGELIADYRQVHFPDNEDQAERAANRFRFSELFQLQLYMILKKHLKQASDTGISFQIVGDHFHAILTQLSFELTDDQKKVMKEIRADMKARYPMNRMLQGDVGSGKTVVAILSMAIAADNDIQSVFMAPTEILAEQHYLNLVKLAGHSGLRITLLTGRLSAAERRKRIAEIQNGMTDIVVGTHAVFQEAVAFHRLGFVIIDEQHRFGVMQRAALLQKGASPDVLVMTATPIPRTLALTVYGDLDTSIIRQLPAGRKPIITAWRKSMTESVFEFLRERLNAGEQVYIVLPLVDESEKVDLKSAIQFYEEVSSGPLTNYSVGLLHGKMSSDDKDDTMRRFSFGEINILVSTTVIEVGVDVPNATVMVVIHADRFGLSQLHQLRGRVGRGTAQSYCILVTDASVSTDAQQRIEVMCETNDGFEIAEFDLKLRGIGELTGTRQSGYTDTKIAHLLRDRDLLFQARESAEKLLSADPLLSNGAHASLNRMVRTVLPQRYGLMEIA